MSASEFVVLCDLFLNGQSSISEIVARNDIAQSRVSFCIKQLVERGWVLTTTDPADGRKTLARVTERVEIEGMRRRTQDAQDALAPLLAGCSPTEREAITGALQKIYQLVVDAGNETLQLRHLETRQDMDAIDTYAPRAANRPA